MTARVVADDAIRAGPFRGLGVPHLQRGAQAVGEEQGRRVGRAVNTVSKRAGGRDRAMVVRAHHTMTLLLSIFLTDILPVFVIAGAGFLLARLVGASVKTMSHAVFYVALPCLAFRLIVSSNGMGEVLGRMVLLAITMTLTMAAVGAIVAKALRLDRVARRAFLLVVMFSNVGNYGLPVVGLAFGEGALPYATVFFLTGSSLMYTLGTFIAAGARANVAAALRKVFRMPALYGVLLALLVVSTGISVPVPIMRPVTLLSEAALPMMILVLGMQLERAEWPKRPVVVGSAVAVSLVAAPFIAAVSPPRLASPGRLARRRSHCHRCRLPWRRRSWRSNSTSIQTS